MKCSSVCNKLNVIDLSIMKSIKNLKNKNAKKKAFKGQKMEKDPETTEVRWKITKAD